MSRKFVKDDALLDVLDSIDVDSDVASDADIEDTHPVIHKSGDLREEQHVAKRSGSKETEDFPPPSPLPTPSPGYSTSSSDTSFTSPLETFCGGMRRKRIRQSLKKFRNRRLHYDDKEGGKCSFKMYIPNKPAK